MKSTWRQIFRRLAAGSTVALSAAWSSAVCYAVQLASDNASNPAYNDGWQAGDNGGFGFTPWNFDGTYATPPPGQQRMDDGLKVGGADSSMYNDLGRSWTLFNPVFEDNNRDIAQAGRGFAPLAVGQTLRTVIDNPMESLFFRGWTLRFNTGGESICYGNVGCTTGSEDVKPRLSVGTFEYFTDGQWYSGGENTLYNTDTDQGVQIDFTLTGADTYNLAMTPLDTTVAPYLESGTLSESGPIDWLEFEFYNTLHDPNFDTDFFIRSIEIIGDAPAGVPGDYNDDGTVNAADYVVWRNGGPLENEVAGITPGMVTPEDYNAWRARFGNTSGSVIGGSGAISAAIPEPATFVCFVAAGAGLSLFARRSGR